MTEQQALNRIKAALYRVRSQTLADDEDCDILAAAAWEEMKRIAQSSVRQSHE